jgi:glycosyltransferase involved in cell wall biosynthesis
MITIIYPYRNRESERIERSLDSLVRQVNENFKVFFIDYGSKKEIAVKIKELVEKYTFCTYYYLFTELQPWNKSKALNFAIKSIETEYCFVADVDMIFHPDFVSILYDKLKLNTVVYFRVGFLSEEESSKNKSFEDYKIKFLSNHEATGLSLFPVEKLKEIQGFDEFFHFWGAEDTDVHNRLRNIGCDVNFYDEEILILHQWHFNYRKRETKKINVELQLTRIVELNHIHLFHNVKNNISKTNSNSWGNSIKQNEFQELDNFPAVKLFNKKTNIDYFLFHELPNSKDKIIALEFINETEFNMIKYNIKKFFGKKVPEFYILKEVNDLILQHIISFYHTKPYIYVVNNDLKSIIFKIKL